MKRQTIVFVALAVLLLSVGGAWWCSRYARTLEEKRVRLEKEAKFQRSRVDNQKQEEANCNRISALADEIAGRTEWETQKTNLLRWFSHAATAEGVRLSNSGVAKEYRSRRQPTILKALERQRFEVEVQGPYARLVRYIDRVERSPHPMVIEEFTMNASRNLGDHGQATLTVSCLRPKPQEPASDDAENAAGAEQ